MFLESIFFPISFLLLLVFPKFLELVCAPGSFFFSPEPVPGSALNCGADGFLVRFLTKICKDPFTYFLPEWWPTSTHGISVYLIVRHFYGLNGETGGGIYSVSQWKTHAWIHLKTNAAGPKVMGEGSMASGFSSSSVQSAALPSCSSI